MMSVLLLPLGLIPPTLIGWLTLAIIQRKSRVLQRYEQWALGCVTGLCLVMLLMVIVHTTLDAPINLLWFSVVQLIAIILLGGAWYALGLKRLPPAPMSDAGPLPRWARATLIILAAWMTVRILLAGVTFLVLTPTYLDDTLDNWNLRGKVYFVDQALTLVMPSEDPVASPMGVSSYPPTVPLVKTWLATIAGEWNEPLINSVHIVWFLTALCLMYAMLRRFTGVWWAALGTYILACMPLYLMHGTNTYADAFVAAHVFPAVAMLFCALRTEDAQARLSFFRLGAFCAGLLPFTKNEGVLLYLPPILLILCIGLFLLVRSQKMTMRDALIALAWYIGFIAILALPWLTFKWLNGLTFGNAKSVSGLNIGWQDGVWYALFVNTFLEGNWLFLFPLLALLCVWKWRLVFRRYAPLSIFFFVVLLGQWFIFLFTGLAPEARMQTGLARGIIQLLPVVVLLITLVLAQSEQQLKAGFNELARKLKIHGG